MQNKIDLRKLVNEMEDYDLDSIKEELKVFGEIRLQLGYFEYDKEFFGEPCFIFDGEDTVDDLEDDEYYDRYKSKDAGYGISLDKDLNVEYGYFIKGTFHDFKDAGDDDEVKSEICSLLDEADIWISDDVSIVNIDDFHYKCDLEKLVKWIDNPNLSIFVAFDDDEPVESINRDLNSIKETLNNHDKIFLEIGFFGYDNVYADDEPYFMFDANECMGDLEDEYYNKYKFLVAGYGIFIDEDLNVEYGYYTTEAPPSGHGAGDTTIHDFKDAIKGDKIKEKICSLLDAADIWNHDDVSNLPKSKMYCPNCGKMHNDDEKICTECGTKLVTEIEYKILKSERIQAEQEIRNNQIKELFVSLDDLTVRLLAQRMIGTVLWAVDSKENLLNNMLEQYSSSEIIKMSKNIPHDENYTIAKLFNEMDEESARKFAKDYSYIPLPESMSREVILRNMLRTYSTDELYKKLMRYKSASN